MELLYRAETEYTYEEYCKFNRTVQLKINRIHILIAICILGLCFLGWRVGSGMYYFVAIVFPIVFVILFKRMTKKNYASNKMWQGIYIVTEFYEDHMKQETSVGESVIGYDKVYRVLETKTNFYIMVGKNQGLIIVKEGCPEGLEEFIRQLAVSKK